MIKEIMEYQKQDSEAVRLEKKLFDSEYKRNCNQMLSVVKDAKNRSTSLENEAGEIVFTYEQLKKKYDENNDMLEKLSKLDLAKHSQQEVDSVFEKIAAISNNLNVLEKKIMSLAERVNSTLNNFEQTKKKYGSARTKYNENKISLEKEESSIRPELDKVYATLKKLEKSIDPQIMQRYKSIRQDRIFPVLVPLVDKSCGGCRMELPYAAQNKVKEKGYIECEHCRRIIYNP